jgi:murein DD-endopeptidase MepM/ murein hydrolase activator NlpD
MRGRFVALAALTFLLLPKPASAADMKFSWPVACTVGQSCWVVNYVDDDPSKTSAKDFTCGDMTYEGHDGTDIAIKDHKSIADNISVLAAANGTVERTRDSVADGNGTASDLKASEEARNGCGNAVMIDHGNGWETLYCHMKRGSIGVKAGQPVHAGDKIGSVGQSGMAEFAHVHFGVMHNGKIVDPFTGMSPTAGCRLKNATPLWATPVAYETLIPYAAGFSDQLPDTDRLVNDTFSPPRLAATAPILTFWLLIYGAEPGDHIDMKILDPEGNVYVQKSDIQDKKKIRLMKYIGLRTQNHPLHAGTYTGKATLSRTLPDGQVLRHAIENTVVIEHIN